MTAKEALDKLDKTFTGDLEWKIALTEALEKQIPKKILYEEQYYGTPWLCPECEADQIEVNFFTEDGYEPKDKYSYCWKCGQKLDWSVEE